MKKLLFFFIFFLNTELLISAQTHYQNKIENIKYCYNLEYKNSENLSPNNFGKFQIELDIPNQKKWNKIILSEEISKKKENKDKYFFYQNRKRVDAILIVTINDVKCKLIAQIRPHGDLYDHRIGSGLPSLNIKLKKGHIFGIVEFILFRPKTRNYENEVFTTTLFRELGLLAPRSSNIIINYKNISEKFIFQEKINKEFLENSNLREGAIFEGDERFHNVDNAYTKNLSRHRISNSSWSIKTQSNLIASQYSLSLLNKINQFHFVGSSFSEREVVDYFSSSKNINLENFFIDLPIFDSIMTVLNATHGYSREDRRFYFDQMYNKFIPIYYDGGASALSYFNQIIIKPSFEVNNNLKDLTLENGKVTLAGVEGAQKALELFDNLNIKEFYTQLANNGSSINFVQTASLIKILKERLLFLKKINKNKIIQVNLDLTTRSFMEKSFENNDEKRKLIYFNDNFSGFISCNIYGENCMDINFKKNQIAKLLGQELKINEINFIFIGKKIGKSVKSDWYSDSSYFTNIDSQTFFNDSGFKIKFYGKSKIVKNETNKELKLYREGPDSRFLISNGEVNDWNIELIDLQEKESVGSDINGLTGCITFLDVRLSDVILKSKKSKCEDTFNFIRSSGTIKQIDIIGSISDAIDADFSNLRIKKIEINNTVNDCLDFSYGIYLIDKADLNYCGDKGLSVGENSNLEANEIKIFNSKSGIASKDFSKTKINSASIFDTINCLEVYNKKQEFSGASLFVKNLNCKDYKTNLSITDEMSLLEINHNEL